MDIKVLRDDLVEVKLSGAKPDYTLIWIHGLEGSGEEYIKRMKRGEFLLLEVRISINLSRILTIFCQQHHQSLAQD